MTIDQHTPHLNLPLPHPDNLQEDDVLRIRAAFTGIDNKIQAIDSLLASDDINLDTLQELVHAIKAARTELGLVDTLITDRLDTFGEGVTQDFADLQGSVNQQLNTQTAQVNNQLETITGQISNMQASVNTMGALVYAGLLK